MDNDIILKKALLKDAKKIFFWFNHKSSIYNKVKTKNKIDYLDHINWFRESISKKKIFIWIINFKNLKAGQIRLDKISKNKYEIDIYIDINFRKKGIALNALKNIEVHIRNVSIYSTVKRYNKTSLFLFKKAGYKVIYSNFEIIKFKKIL